jgi:hypothetical protein
LTQRHILVQIQVTEAEYRRLTSEANFTGPGTVQSALRKLAGLPVEPYGRFIAECMTEANYLRNRRAGRL